MTPNFYNFHIIVIISRFVVSRCEVMTLSKRTSHRKAVEIESVNKMDHDAPIEQVTYIEDTSIHFTKATGILGHTANLHHSHPKANQASGQRRSCCSSVCIQIFLPCHVPVSLIMILGQYVHSMI